MAASVLSAPVSSPAAYVSGWIASLDLAANADGDAALEAELVAIARSEGPLRAALAELCARFVECSGFERLGFASLGDWAAERVGRSGRTIYDHARVGAALRGLPELRAALGSGALGFSKVRLIARVATAESERRWIEFARGLSVEALAREVRKLDAGSLECGGLARDERPARRLEFACTPEVVALWGAAASVAQQVAGRMLRASERAELIAAEVASALAIDGDSEPERECEQGGFALCAAAGTPDARAALESRSLPTSIVRLLTPLASPRLAEAAVERVAPSVTSPAVPSIEADSRSDSPCASIPSLPIIDAWLAGTERADASELERRLMLAFGFEQRWAAELGPRLDLVLRRGVHLALGFREREAYQRERLGLDPSWCRALLRIERAARCSPVFALAWRAGELSFTQAAALVPLLHAELPEVSVGAWVRRAREFSLRRLRDDVEAALARRECEPDAWLACGGSLESDDAGRASTASESVTQSNVDREIGAKIRGADRDLVRACDAKAEGEISASSITTSAAPARETCRVSMIVESEVAQLFRAVHCSVRRRLEREVGRAVTPGEALGWICAHALHSWNAVDARTRREHRVFARDGWRCAAPGCTRMRGLHAHHVVFRAQGGADEGENLVTLCAYHHLRGVHGGRLRIRGRAPHALRFELGLRAGYAPLAVYASGDRRIGPPRRVSAMAELVPSECSV